MIKTRVIAVLLLIAGLAVGFYVYHSEVAPNAFLSRPFKLGLDLSGGTRLIYDANTSTLNPADVGDAMSSLRDVIEKRVNVFGVSEPLVQTEQAGLGDSAKHRLLVELPGVTDLKQALAIIAQTPVLEFKVLPLGKTINDLANVASGTDPFITSGLTGRFLKQAQVTYGQNSLGPSISLTFNADGSKLFGEITKANVGKPLAIYLDGNLLSAPVVNEPILDGKAEINGQFTVDEAKTLVRNLNLGALPVPITLSSTETIGATLGADALAKGVKAGEMGFLIIALFMIVWYRLPGVVAVVSLAIYSALMLAIFKLVPVTLTAAGIAGFILSIGIAVDANVLIFERLKEELKKEQKMHEAISAGFSRAWLAIRDSNIAHIIAGIILFWFGTALIKGFALTFALGTVLSMFTAISVTRTFLLALGVKHKTKLSTFLFSSGLKS